MKQPKLETEVQGAKVLIMLSLDTLRAFYSMLDDIKRVFCYSDA